VGQDWFEGLTGFRESAYEETRSKLAVADGRLVSLVNGRSWAVGEFEMVSLFELRGRMASKPRGGKPCVSLIRGDVRKLHAAPEYAGALFQVASQFNALEMTGPEITPEDGVTRYAGDHTQGPACALAAAPATICRNYFAAVGDHVGQTRNRQLDGLAEVGRALSAALSRPVSELWAMRNGYALCTRPGLRAISAWLAEADAREIDALRGRLAIGLHRDVEVTAPGASPGAKVSQAFCSALPVGYSGSPPQEWRAFATLVLEAAYEATLLAGALRTAQGRSNIVLLTLLGGGAFGNPREWIFAAIRRAVEQARGFDLDLRVVSYAEPDQRIIGFVDSL
jgi:hypothetical protein